MMSKRIGKRGGRRALAAVGASSLIAGSLAFVTAQTAAATGTPDLSVVQAISGSTQSGHTFDTFVIKNHGSAAASHLNLEILNTSTSKAGVRDILAGGNSVCEVMPAPATFTEGTACQFPAALAAGASISITADFSGSKGAAFTTLAEVGEFQVDANYKDNSSTRTTYFGPAVDLAVAGTDKVGTKKRHTTANLTVVDRGPNNANHVQVVSEFTSGTGALAHGTSGASCQIVPAGSGYAFAASCVFDLLKTGKAFTISYDISGGTTGHTCKVVTTVTSFGADPNTKNNKISRSSKFK